MYGTVVITFTGVQSAVVGCRRILQVMLTTSRIRMEVSKFVKQEIHSLVNYMHSNLTHQQVATTISRHFAKVTPPPLSTPPLRTHTCLSSRNAA